MSLKTLQTVRAKTSPIYISTDSGVTYEKVGNVTSKSRNRNVSEIDVTTDESLEYEEFIPERESSEGTFALLITKQVVNDVLNYDDLQGLVDNKTIFYVQQKFVDTGDDVLYLRRAFITSLAETGETRNVLTATCNIRFTGGPIETSAS